MKNPVGHGNGHDAVVSVLHIAIELEIIVFRRVELINRANGVAYDGAKYGWILHGYFIFVG